MKNFFSREGFRAKGEGHLGPLLVRNNVNSKNRILPEGKFRRGKRSFRRKESLLLASQEKENYGGESYLMET